MKQGECRSRLCQRQVCMVLWVSSFEMRAGTTKVSALSESNWRQTNLAAEVLPERGPGSLRGQRWRALLGAPLRPEGERRWSPAVRIAVSSL
jgi:hypothetical protein